MQNSTSKELMVAGVVSSLRSAKASLILLQRCLTVLGITSPTNFPKSCSGWVHSDTVASSWTTLWHYLCLTSSQDTKFDENASILLFKNSGRDDVRDRPHCGCHLRSFCKRRSDAYTILYYKIWGLFSLLCFLLLRCDPRNILFPYSYATAVTHAVALYPLRAVRGGHRSTCSSRLPFFIALPF